MNTSAKRVEDWSSESRTLPATRSEKCRMRRSRWRRVREAREDNNNSNHRQLKPARACTKVRNSTHGSGWIFFRCLLQHHVLNRVVIPPTAVGGYFKCPKKG